MAEDGELTLQIRRVAAVSRFPDGSLEVAIETSRGIISGILHPVEGGRAAVIWVSGALGGYNGPAHGLYPVLARRLAARGISSLRITYRWPNELEDCVLDTLAASSVLRGLGATTLAVAGHSFGGAVAILAGTIDASLSGVVALSSQVAGTHSVAALSPRPLFLLHGQEDERLPARASEIIYEAASDPKTLVLVPGAGHSLNEAANAVQAQVEEWLLDLLPPDPPSGPQGEPEMPLLETFSVATERHPDAMLEVRTRDLLASPADAIVCPANDLLLPDGSVAGQIIMAGGGDLAARLRDLDRPQPLGAATLLETPELPCRYLVQAVISRADNPFAGAGESTVREAALAALRAADDHGLRSIAFPALGTGAGGVAVEQSARAIVSALRQFLLGSRSVQNVIVCLPTDTLRRIFAEAAAA